MAIHAEAALAPMPEAIDAAGAVPMPLTSPPSVEPEAVDPSAILDRARKPA